MLSDKEIERNRYDNKALKISGYINRDYYSKLYGISSFNTYLKAPYEKYYALITNYITEEHTVLELGSGIGNHTEAILKTRSKVIASDISVNSLNILKNTFGNKYKKLKILEADMEKIPLKDNSCDVVVSAGSISYGSKDLVRSEIFRLLKPGGYLIIVDSLNNNLFYTTNRYLRYLFGNRSKSTLRNMYKFSDFEKFKSNYDIKEINFFGSIIWIVPIIKFFLSDDMINKVINRFDSLINVKKSAFKFTLVLRKHLSKQSN